MFFWLERKAFGWKFELGDIEEAEEAVFDRLRCIIGNFDGLLRFSVKLDDLGWDSDLLFLHSLLTLETNCNWF